MLRIEIYNSFSPNDQHNFEARRGLYLAISYSPNLNFYILFVAFKTRTTTYGEQSSVRSTPK